jgi:hypothetical protein
VPENLFDYKKLKKIPKEFHSDLENVPFSTCTFCSKSLLKSHDLYMIEKSYKVNPVNGKKNTLFEYAICLACNIRKMESMSKESIQNIRSYMENNFVLEEWDLQKNNNLFEKCIVTGKPVKELEEYNIVGQFIGDKMIVGHFPILLSPSIGDEIQELLSQKTKDEFDDFMNTINGIPTELKELFKTRRPILA